MKTIILSPGNKKIQIENHDTVLTGLEKHGLVLPNNCRAGACGECKVKVLEGTFDQGFILDMALSKEDREKGMGLMCMAKVTSESLTIDFQNDNILSKLPTPIENAPYMVIDLRLVTKSILKLTIKSLGMPLRFWPGQHIMLGGKEKYIPYRAYSVANLPNERGEIILYVTKIDSGITSNYIHNDIQIGETISINGPYGTFIGDPKVELPVLCIANGSGLAPIMSLTEAALSRGGFRYPATILFSAKTSEDLFEIGQFKYLEKKYRNFKFIPTLTKEINSHFKNGRITKILPDLYPDLTYYSIYIAGSNDFVKDVKEVVLSLSAKEENIHTENFVSKLET